MAKRKKSTEDQSNEENINESDDNFGLPEIEYEPLNREGEPTQEEIIQPEERQQESSFNEDAPGKFDYDDQQLEDDQLVYNHTEPPSSQSSALKIIGILVLLALLGGGIWYFGFEKPKKDAAEKERLDLVAKQESNRMKEDQRIADLKRQADEQRRADSLANAVPKEGSIETLSERTGRYYVVVASAIDGDLIMDYAKKLSVKGVSAKIIPPFRKTKFHRIAVDVGDTYADAQAKADALKSEYGDGAWVVRY